MLLFFGLDGDSPVSSSIISGDVRKIEEREREGERKHEREQKTRTRERGTERKIEKERKNGKDSK